MEIRIGAKFVEALRQVRRNSSSSPSSAKLSSSSSSVGWHREIWDVATWVLIVSTPRPHTAHAELKPPTLTWNPPTMVPCWSEATHSDLTTTLISNLSLQSPDFESRRRRINWRHRSTWDVEKWRTKLCWNQFRQWQSEWKRENGRRKRK